MWAVHTRAVGRSGGGVIGEGICTMWVRAIARAALVAAWASPCACVDPPGHGDAAPAPSSIEDAELAPLRAFEAERRRATDFATLPTSDVASGPDPYAIRALPGESGFVGILRGRGALVVLDRSLREVQRLPVASSPTALAVSAHEVIVASELSSSLARYRIHPPAPSPAAGPPRLERTGSIELPGVRAIRDLAFGSGGDTPHPGTEGVVYVVEEYDGRLITLELGKPAEGGAPRARVDQVVGGGPLRVRRAGGWVLVDCLLDHVIVARPVGGAGVPAEGADVRLVNDGPFWSFEARATAEGVLVAAGGVEDHPLDRTKGSFGFVDSFVYLFRIAGGSATRVAAVNVSALGVITPKALALEVLADGGADVTVTGYGGDKMARLSWGADLAAEPRVELRDLPPGTSALAPLAGGGLALANPLLDVWATVSASGSAGTPAAWTPVSVPDPAAAARSWQARLGEALFFTSRMAPYNRSDGQLSRFTCETCHFEGYVDGRTHHTGRADVHATTKPLLGLFNNRPHFSRALDPDLTTVAHAEFRVAGALSDHDPWFALDPAAAPWVRGLGVPEGEISALELRRALMTFLMEFTHRPNPTVVGRVKWTEEERVGAEVFRDRCERCHSARLVSDDPGSAVPFDRWEALVMSPAGPIVWGRAGYEKTGIEPYVHEKGARVPSLRRLYKKRPYFTNGSARSLGDVLARARWAGSAFFHEAPVGGPGAVAADALDERSRVALLAFLDLL